MKRIIAMILCFVSFSAFLVPVAQAETTEFILEINPEERYTDISEMDDNNRKIFANEIEEANEAESNKMVYIIVLCILLVIAVIVLIVSLKKVPPADDDDEEEEVSVKPSPKKKQDLLSEEEKSTEEKPNNKKKDAEKGDKK